MNKPANATRLFRRAKTAHVEGNYEVAIELYRRVLGLDPAHSKAKVRLSSLLEHRANQLVGEDLDGAIELYQEAWAADCSRAKLWNSYRCALRRKLCDVLLEDAQVAVRDLLERVREDDELGASAGAPALLGPEIEQLVEELPLVPFHGVSGGSAHGRWLVLLDSGIDVDLLPAILRGLPPADFYRRDSLSLGDPGHFPGPVTPLGRAESVGFQTETRLCEESDVAAGEVLAELRRALPAHAVKVQGLDILQHLSFEIDDLYFTFAKETFALHRILQSCRHEVVLIVTGDGVLAEAVHAILEADAIDVRLKEIRCPSSSSASAAWRPASLDPRAPAARANEAFKPRSSWTSSSSAFFKDLVSLARLLLRRFTSDRAQLRCALLARAHIRHISNVTTVAAKIDERLEVIAVPLDPSPKRSDEHRPYKELARLRKNARVTKAWFIDPEASVEEFAALVRGALDAAPTQAALMSGVVSGIRVGPSTRPALERLLKQRVPFLQQFAARIDRFLRLERPDVLLVSPDRTSEIRVACSLARRRGIPTIFPQMAFFSRSPRYKPLQADVVCVLDEHHRSLFVEYFGAAPEQVHVTGIPRFDAILTKSERGVPLAPCNGSVLLVLQPLAIKYNEDLVELLIDTVRGAGGRLRIKLHPRDSEASLRAFSSLVSERLPGRGTAYWKEDVHALICASDVVVSTFSNVVLEAAMLDRPVICTNLTGEPLPVPFVDQGVAIGADSPAELRRCVAQAVRDPEFRDMIRSRSSSYFARNPHLLSGRATDRVASLVASMAQEHRRRASRERKLVGR